MKNTQAVEAAEREKFEVWWRDSGRSYARQERWEAWLARAELSKEVAAPVTELDVDRAIAASGMQLPIPASRLHYRRALESFAASRVPVQGDSDDLAVAGSGGVIMQILAEIAQSVSIYPESDQVRQLLQIASTRFRATPPQPSAQELAAGAFYPQVTGYATQPPKDAAPVAVNWPLRETVHDVAKRMYAQRPTFRGTTPLNWTEAPNSVKREWLDKATALYATPAGVQPSLVGGGNSFHLGSGECGNVHAPRPDVTGYDVYSPEQEVARWASSERARGDIKGTRS